MTEIELSELSKSVIKSLNTILKVEDMRLLKSDDKIHFISINNDLELIGSGGFAKVYKVKSSIVILKKLKEDLLLDNHIVSRFKREYQITKSLGNLEGVIRVFDYDSHNVSYTMELADSDLYHHINKKNFNNQEKLNFIFNILEIISKVHKREIIHRDLSPGNILIVGGELKISDFGLGKDLSVFHSHQTNHTNSFGQYYYCDPKLFMNLKDGDKLSDIYSLGRLINFIETLDPLNENHRFGVITQKAASESDSARYHPSFMVEKE